jgi:GNAT superfamily N-acetyltransferase
MKKGRAIMKTGNDLSQVVYGYWSRRFNCERETVTRPGTLVIKEDELAESGNVHLYRIDRLSILRIAPSLAAKTGLSEGYQSDLGALDVSKLQTLIPVELTSTLLDFYLDPKDFQCFTAGDGLSTRQLGAENDKNTLLGLYQACTEADLDAAEVSLDEPDPVIFGIFDGTQLVAYAGHRYWDDVIADIGVLIHPKYRSRGLGKAVVSALCEWCFRNDIVPMYRVFMSHPHSRRIPEALGFREWVIIETLKAS